MWSSHMQRIREWRHPLKKSLPEMGESAPDRLTCYCMMHGRMWEHPHLSEYESIVCNNVLDVVLRREDKSVVSSQWIYKVKQAAYGSVEKHKARFVASDFLEVEQIGYDETFSPVASYSSIRSIIALSMQMGWKIHQMDVNTAFLNDTIEEDMYIE
eukprot:PITA_35815